MSTFINLGLTSLSNRLSEIDLILDEADNYLDSNQVLYNTLCRSAQVLLSAHFEGYLKDLVKNSLDDINRYSNFKSTNTYLKRLYCEHFILIKKDDKNSKGLNKRVEEMISIFDELNTKFNKDYFSYRDNQNPKATVIDKIAEQYGIKKLFDKLTKSNLNILFSNTLSENTELKESLKNKLLDLTQTYPYNLTLEYLEIDQNNSTSGNLWNAFLSDMLKRRHDIAHGREIENASSSRKIKEDRIKVEILLYAFTTFICVNSNPATEE